MAINNTRGFHLYNSRTAAVAGAEAQIRDLHDGILESRTLLAVPITIGFDRGQEFYRSQFRPTHKSAKDWRRTLWNGAWDTVDWAPRI